jgi:hypothetical protein
MWYDPKGRWSILAQTPRENAQTKIRRLSRVARQPLTGLLTLGTRIRFYQRRIELSKKKGKILGDF